MIDGLLVCSSRCDGCWCWPSCCSSQPLPLSLLLMLPMLLRPSHHRCLYYSLQLLCVTTPAAYQVRHSVSASLRPSSLTVVTVRHSPS